MIRGFHKKQLIILGGTFLLLLLVFAYLYFFLLDPVKKDLSAKQSELRNEETILSTVQAKAGTGTSVDFKSTTELQKRLPVQPLTDQFVLNLEKAEVVSNSFIIDMEFKDGDTSADTKTGEPVAEEDTSESPDASGQESKENETKAEGSSGEGDEAVSEQEKTDTETMLPNSLRKVSAKLNVQYSSYEELLTFLQSLLSTSRIVTIDGLKFKGPEEVTTRDQSKESLKYELITSIYYYPTLKDLQEQSPTVVTPKPSEKKNPFSGNEQDDAEVDPGQ